MDSLVDDATAALWWMVAAELVMVEGGGDLRACEVMRQRR